MNVSPPADAPSRLPRIFRTVVRLLVLAVLLLAVWSAGIEPRWVARREIGHAVPHWQGPPGLRVAVASDWHITDEPLLRVMTPARARAIVADINAARPDVVLLPGDFVADRGFATDDPAQLPEDAIAAILGGLRAPLGVYAVLGNHDGMLGIDRFRAALGRQGIRVLQNQAVRLPDTPVWVVGVGDEISGESEPARAVAAVPPRAQALVMMHEPSSLRELPPIDGLIVAGHMHGGQIVPPFIGPFARSGKTPVEWSYGWVFEGPHAMYVTSGLGVSLLPLRFNRRPEWVLFTLRDALA